MSTTRRGVPYQTNVKEVSWKPDANDEERKISIDRKTVAAISGAGRKGFSECELPNLLQEKGFDEYLKGVTKSLQTKYNAEIADHRL